LIKNDFTSGEIVQIFYDSTSCYLELVWRNKTVLAFKPVPEEVFRRLCNAPNRAVYYEDRVAEEYPKVPVQRRNAGDVKSKLDDLFG
jgi:hypothetical protein